MTSERRQKKLVNFKFQRAIVRRFVSHSILFAWTVFLIILGCWSIAATGEENDSSARMHTICLAAIIASTVVALPVIIFDAVKFGHRIAGPILRMKNTLPLIGQETLAKVELRGDDFWQDFALEFNAMVDRVEAMRQELAATRTSGDPNRLRSQVPSLPA